MFALLFGFVLFCSVVIHTSTARTCLECRATLRERRVFGIPVDSIEQNAYSASVLAQEPNHIHHWRWCGSKHSHTFIGGEGLGCGRRHPIWGLPVQVQAEYAHLVPPL